MTEEKWKEITLAFVRWDNDGGSNASQRDIINWFKDRLTEEKIISSSPLLSEVSPPSDQYPDNEADGIVWCGKCGARK